MRNAGGLERDAAFATIYPVPTRGRAKVGRVDIGAQMMTGNTGRSFDAEDMLGRYPLGTLEPFPDGRLLNATNTRKFTLRACNLEGLFKGFERGGDRVHIPNYSKNYRAVNPKTNMARYSYGYR